MVNLVDLGSGRACRSSKSVSGLDPVVIPVQDDSLQSWSWHVLCAQAATLVLRVLIVTLYWH